MKPLTTPLSNQKAAASYRLSERLPVGLTIHRWKESADQLNISLPVFDEQDLVLTFINYKGDLHIATGNPPDNGQPASPGLGLLSTGNKEFQLKSFSPIHLSVIVLLIPRDWIGLFLKDNPNFSKIEQALETESNIITCRLGRRQLSLFSSIMNLEAKGRDNLLEIQNHALSLLEFFLCSRHRNLSAVHAAAGIDNEDDLSLIKEVESYISEYYCSDTFTVDSILKKTYTSYHKLNFLFKSTHGMTISEYIRNKRIEKSKEMIADNAKSISQIAYEIGYSSISNYILAFKKIYQITPGKYKKQMDSLA
ncbi:MAG TPA: AraC family transcriptional regulator [Puia sp.]|nr:AraC family transcriptional regulator [Puia sp.]